MSKTKPTTIAEYIDSAPKEAQKNLRELYSILKEVAPEAREAIKWSSPVFEEKRILFAFAAFKSHLNFMPTPSAMEPFKKELEKYKTGKWLNSNPLRPTVAEGAHTQDRRASR